VIIILFINSSSVYFTQTFVSFRYNILQFNIQWAGYDIILTIANHCAVETLIAQNNWSGDVINRCALRTREMSVFNSINVPFVRTNDTIARSITLRIHATVGLYERKSLVTKCRGLLTRDNHRWVSVLSKNRRAVDKSEVSHFVVRSPDSYAVS